MKCKPRIPLMMPCGRVAWGVDVPKWVARKCHLDVHGHKLTVHAFNGVSMAKEGDVILAVDAEQKQVTVVSEEDFKRQFEVVEE